MELDVQRHGVTLRASTLGIVLVIAGCSHSGVNPEPGPPAISSRIGNATPTPTSTTRAAALPAVRAYEAFNKAANEAQRHPFSIDDKPPAGADFRKYSWDPLRAQYTSFIWGLVADGSEYRGTPPTLNVTVKEINLQAKDWPTVILSDCQTDDSKWRLHNAKTGAVQPRAKQKVSPPYRSTVTMIYYKKRWGVQKIVLDANRTCTA